MTPVTQPTISWARRDRKKDPCAQSCMMMNDRTSSPAAGSARIRVMKYESDSDRYISQNTTASGTRVVIICVIARVGRGSWYRATIELHCLVVSPIVEAGRVAPVNGWARPAPGSSAASQWGEVWKRLPLKYVVWDA